MKKVATKNDENMSKVTYLVHFVTRAFLLAVLCSMVIFFLIVSVYFGDLLINSKNEDVKSPIFSTYLIVSPSMVPTIKINDAIVVKRIDNDNYKVGDIITYSSVDPNSLGLSITHRIMNKEKVNSKNSIYTTKGDNNKVADPTGVATSTIKGKVLFKIPKIGYIKDFFSKPINYFICLLIPTIIFVIYEGGRMFFAVNGKKEI